MFIDLEGSDGNGSNSEGSNRTNSGHVHNSSRGRSRSSSRSDGRGSLADDGADTRSSRADNGADGGVNSGGSLGRSSESESNGNELVHLFVKLVAGVMTLFIPPYQNGANSCMATPKKESIRVVNTILDIL